MNTAVLEKHKSWLLASKYEFKSMKSNRRFYRRGNRQSNPQIGMQHAFDLIVPASALRTPPSPSTSRDTTRMRMRMRSSTVTGHLPRILPDSLKPAAPTAPLPVVMSAEAPDADAPDSDFSKLFDVGARPFRLGHRECGKLVVALSTISDEYKSKMDSLLANFGSALDDLPDARTRFNGAYERYKQCGEELRAAPDVPELKPAFVEAQRAAVALHTNLNDLTLQIAMKIESALTQFEEIEVWRSEKLAQFLKGFAQWCADFAQSVDETNVLFCIRTS